MCSPVFHPWYIFNNCYSLASILVTDIMFWKRDAMWMHSELVWSSQVQVAYEPQRVGAPGKWCYTPVFSAPPPASFHPGGNWQLLSGTVRGLSHTLAHFISTLFLWSGCFLSPFYWGGNWGSDGFNDWSTMPLLLRGRVRIWASEPVPWAAEAQWWSLVQRSLWEDPWAGLQRSWRGVCGVEAGLALVAMVDDRPLCNMWSQVFF